jgi:hypothetical protein
MTPLSGPILALRRTAARAGQARSYAVAIGAAGAATALTVTMGLAPAQAAPTAAAPTAIGAGPAAAHGVLHVYEVGTSTRSNHDVITGMFSDFGTDHLDVLDHGNANKLVLTKGSFEANVKKLHARLKVVSNNPRTCTLVLKSTAPVALSHGTGRYRGLRGTLRVTVVNAVVFPKKNGHCAENIRKPVRANVTTVTGSGRVSVPAVRR